MAEPKTLRVLGIAGSLRAESYNRSLLRVAVGAAPPEMKIDTADISAIPLYNEDVRTKGFPPPVETLRQQVAAADAILIATPEYNYSMPGVLKNAIDWVSRPPNQPFEGKPLAIMGASMGNGGTMRAQYHLRQTVVFLDMRPLNKPELFVSRAQEKFDASGQLTDEGLRENVRKLLGALVTWTRQLQGGGMSKT